MASERRLHVFCYDVAADAVRRKVAALLEDLAVRVQDSVFEARITARQAERLGQRVAQLLGPGDSLRMYIVPAAAITSCKEWGRGPAIEEQDFYLL